LPSPEPTLHDPALNVINSIFGGTGTVQGNLGQKFGFTMPPELISAFSNYLGQPTGEQRTNAATLSMQGGLGGAANIPGYDVLNAAGPIFSRNLTESLARQNNQGPRFSSTNDAQGRLLQQQGLQDFNLFAQQVLEQGRALQLEVILGYAQANQGQQQLQLQALVPLINALFIVGLSQGAAVGKSLLGQTSDLIGAIGSLVAAGKGGSK